LLVNCLKVFGGVFLCENGKKLQEKNTQNKEG